MKIERIKIKKFKVFKDTEIKNLPNMCVFLGANGSGKSTLFDVFGFLSDSLKNNVKAALDIRGGFKEVISRDQTGDIEFEIKFRNEEEEGKREPLISYKLKIGLVDKKPIVKNEVLAYRRGQKGRPWKFLDFKKGEGAAIINEEEYGKEGVKEKRERQVLDSPDILAIKGLGQFQKFKAISSFRKLLENWYISNFQIQAARTIQDIGVDGRIILKFQDSGFRDPFIARYVSDGTIKMFGYLILLHDPNPTHCCVLKNRKITSIRIYWVSWPRSSGNMPAGEARFSYRLIHPILSIP